MNIFLEIFLYFDVFVIGAAAAVALRHAHAHFRSHAEAAAPHPSANKAPALSQEIRDKLLMETEQKYRSALDKSAEQLNREMGMTTEKIEASLKKLTEGVIAKELEGFSQLFKQYEERAVKELETAKAQTDNYQNELKSKVEAEVKAEKERLLNQIDNRLADTVMSFLTEALQHEVDLGNQTKYLLAVLEEHKAEFKQAVNDEA